MRSGAFPFSAVWKFLSVLICVHPWFQFSVVKAVAQLDENFARVVPVETAEGLAVIKFHPAIGHIQGVQGCGESVAEILAERKIEGRVLWQVVPGIWRPWKGVAEAGAVVNIRGGVRLPRKSDFAAEIEGIALVVIKGE